MSIGPYEQEAMTRRRNELHYKRRYDGGGLTRVEAAELDRIVSEIGDAPEQTPSVAAAANTAEQGSRK